MRRRTTTHNFEVGNYVVLGRPEEDEGMFDNSSDLRLGMVGRIIHVYTLNEWMGRGGGQIADVVRVTWGRRPDYDNLHGRGWNIRASLLLSPDDPEAIRLLLGGGVA